jgi:serine/threonine protein kinase
MTGTLPETIALLTRPARSLDALLSELSDLLVTVDRFPLRFQGTAGEGRSGCVLLATDELDGRVVAVKVFGSAHLDEPIARERSVREIRAMHYLRGHPNVAHVFHTFAFEGRIFLVMEYEERGELFDLVVEHGPLREDVAAFIFRQLALAVQHCHALGVLHRDLKPENALLSRDFSIKLCDFGFCNFLPGSALDVASEGSWSTEAARRHKKLTQHAGSLVNGKKPSAAGAAAVPDARATGSRQQPPFAIVGDGTTTQDPDGEGDGSLAAPAARRGSAALSELPQQAASNGAPTSRDTDSISEPGDDSNPRSITTPCGSPLYAAPEVFRSLPYDDRADLWSLGVNLYVLVTGASPWGAGSVRAQKARIQRGQFDPLPEDISLPCRSLIANMLSVDPKRRPTIDQVWA